MPPDSSEQQSEPRSSLTAAASGTLAASVLGALLALVNVVLVARALGPEGRGEVTFLLTLAAFSAQVGSLGVHEANLNFAAAEGRLTGPLATNSVVLALVTGTVTAGAVGLLVALVPAAGGGTDAGLRWLCLAAIPLIVVVFDLRLLITAHHRFAFVNVAWLLPSLLNAVVNAALFAAGALTVGLAVGVWLAGQLLVALLFAAFVVRQLGGFGRPDRALAGRTLGFGVRANAGRLLNYGNYRLDQLLMGALSSQRQLGLYSVAVSWAEALFFLPSALASVQRPRLVRGTAQQAGEQTARAFRMLVLLTAVLAGAMAALAPLLCVGLFGAEFEDSVAQLRVLLLGSFGVVAVKLLGTTLTARGLPLRETAAIAVAFGCTITLDLLLIPAYGGMGAAIASTVAYAAGGATIVVIFARALDVAPLLLVPRVGDARQLAGLPRRLLRERG